MLEGVVQRGTATQVKVLGRPIAGKTGTTNEYRSAWFVGFSPDLVVGVFVGYDDNRSLGEGETGGVSAVPIFIDFMQEALKGKPKDEFKPPRTARFGMVNGIREAFKPGTEPRYEARPATGMPTDGPRPYIDAFKPVGPAAPATDDLNGLY
jgi:penicillin-binding protein 1A